MPAPDLHPVADLICEKCFNDRHLSRLISQGNDQGTCYWCGAVDVARAPMHVVAEPLREMIQTLYVPARFEHGETLPWLLDHDWDLFSDSLREANLDRLLQGILQAGLKFEDMHAAPDPDALYVPATEETSLGAWIDHLAQRLAPDDDTGVPSTETSIYLRDFPDQVLRDAVQSLAGNLPEGSRFFRARIHRTDDGDRRFSSDDLGPPPAEKCNAGRANKPGRPVLYTATDNDTAIAEVRPWRGATVAVSSVTAVANLRIVDLRERAFEIESPFFDEEILWKVDLIGLFHRLGVDFSLPVEPGHEARYTPCQTFAELTVGLGFHGIAYPSAVGPGSNVVIFPPMMCDLDEPDYYRVRDVHHDCQPLHNLSPLQHPGFYDIILAS